jgi:hypothetical protein
MGLAQNNFDLGGLAGSAMRMGFGARGMTMANALSADASGDGTGYYNPAVVPFQLHPSALISAGILPLDRSLNSAGYIQSLKPTGGFHLRSSMPEFQSCRDGITMDYQLRHTLLLKMSSCLHSGPNCTQLLL